MPDPRPVAAGLSCRRSMFERVEGRMLREGSRRGGALGSGGRWDEAGPTHPAPAL